MRAMRPLIWIFIFFSVLYQCAAVSELNHRQLLEEPRFEPFHGLKCHIAVLDFENHSAHGGDTFGSAVTDRLITLLVKSGRFVVIERQKINEVLKEQALGQSGAITDETGPQVGKLLGVQAVIMGSVLEAEQKTDSHKLQDKESDNPWKFALKATVGHVKISYRMVDVETGEVILANNVKGTDIRPGLGIKTKDFDFEDMFDLDETVVGFALRKAMKEMVDDILSRSPKLEWRGKIVKINVDRTLYFTPGLNAGVSKGDRFRIYREQPIEDGSDVTELVAVGLVQVNSFIGQQVVKAAILDGDLIETGDVVKQMRSTKQDIGERDQ